MLLVRLQTVSLLPALLALLTATGCARLAPAQMPPKGEERPPGSDPAYQRLDFWIVSWEVHTPDGGKTGTNFTERPLGRSAVLEHWTRAAGCEGKSRNCCEQRRQ